jgi:DNA-binding XRE family transcriptional regulator
MNNKITLSKIIRDERRLNKITQKHLARIANVTTKTISDIENARIDPQFSTVKKICKTLGITIDFTAIEN